MSPGALQYEMGSHRPSNVPVPDAPRQFVEQQSAGYAQASPSVLHEPPVRTSQRWSVPQMPEQHWPPSAQD